MPTDELIKMADLDELIDQLDERVTSTELPNTADQAITAGGACSGLCSAVIGCSVIGVC
ncbi:hypothetical protein ACH4E8_13420 [Streptomyces sp. NPDC017979]|uniref:hypothetical protein n=1 Tax=unclassified Streptomyces TaxID=2593676 RepID=UPI00378DAE1D